MLTLNKKYLLLFLVWGTGCFGMQSELAFPEELRPFILTSLSEDYLFKGNIDRLINAERMRRCIAKNNLTLLRIPRKYLYLDPSRKRVNVYAETIQQDPQLTCYLFSRTQFSLKEVQQLVTLVYLTGYYDFGIGNIVRDLDGNIVFLDTEDSSFYSTPYTVHECLDRVKETLNGWTTQNSLAWIESEKERFRPQESRIPLPFSTEFDSSPENMRYLAERKNREAIKTCLWEEEYVRTKLSNEEEKARKCLTFATATGNSAASQQRTFVRGGRIFTRVNP